MNLWEDSYFVSPKQNEHFLFVVTNFLILYYISEISENSFQRIEKEL